MKGFGGMGQMGQMMKQAQMMQMNIKKAQEQLATIEVTGEAGNGAVKVTMTCKNECRRVAIDDSLFGAAEDKDMLEDLLVAALNDAQKKIEAEVQAKMSAATGGMKLPF
jgi:hypothetical protein